MMSSDAESRWRLPYSIGNIHNSHLIIYPDIYINTGTILLPNNYLPVDLKLKKGGKSTAK